MITAAQTQVEALHALNVKKFVGVTYFVGSVNDITTQYFQDAGFEVLGMLLKQMLEILKEIHSIVGTEVRKELLPSVTSTMPVRFLFQFPLAPDVYHTLEGTLGSH